MTLEVLLECLELIDEFVLYDNTNKRIGRFHKDDLGLEHYLNQKAIRKD